MKLNSKKGDIVIVMFVIMTLALTSSVLLMIYLGDKNIKAAFQNPKEVSNLYAESEILNSYVVWTLTDAMINSYDEIALSQEYIKDSPDCIINGQKFFCGLSSSLSNVIQQKVLEKFLMEINTNLDELKEDLEGKKTKLIFDITQTNGFYDNVFHLSVTNNTLIYNPEEGDVIIRHKFDIAKNIDFESIGLDSFEEIWEKIEICKLLDFKACFKLDNFDTKFENVVISDISFIETTLVSKEELYINEQTKKLEFSFLVKN